MARLLASRHAVTFPSTPGVVHPVPATHPESPRSAAPVDPHALIERPSSIRPLSHTVTDAVLLLVTLAIAWSVAEALSLSLWESMLVSGLVVGGRQLVLALVRSSRARTRRS